MPTRYYNLNGKAYWPELRANQPDEYSGDKRWKITLALDDVNEFNKTGLQLKLKEVDGVPSINLRRSCKKLIGDDLVNFTAPVIIDSEGKWIRHFVRKDDDGKDELAFSWIKGQPEPEMIGEDVFIPNGSEVTVRVAVYDTQKGKGHRLESVKIRHLAERISVDKPRSENQAIEAASEASTNNSLQETETSKETIKAPW